MTDAGTGRATPFYCPYCGDEDLRPDESSHGAWHCASCTRIFALSFKGLHGLAARAPQGTTT